MYEDLVVRLNRYSAERQFHGGITAEAADAIRDMNMMLPPIAIGTQVYFVDWRNEVCQGTVSMIQQKADKSWKFRVSENGSVFDRAASDIGKRIFLTAEEAYDYAKK